MLPELFKNILIPVDLGESTAVAVKQAIELVPAGSSVIHLLHIIKLRSIWDTTPQDTEAIIVGGECFCARETLKKLQEWKRAIEETVPEVNVKIHIVEGTIHDKIIETAKKLRPQLIILGKKSHYRFLSFFRPLCPDELAGLTDCPVLNVMKGSINSKIKTIVVPVRDFIPRRKIEFLVAFAKMFRAKIHLVALQDRMSEADTVKRALLDTYRILRSVLTNPIEYHLLNNSNYPKAILKFAESVGADMIFVNPQAETKLSVFTGRHINDALGPASKLKILYLEPYPVSLGN